MAENLTHRAVRMFAEEFYGDRTKPSVTMGSAQFSDLTQSGVAISYAAVGRVTVYDTASDRMYRVMRDHEGNGVAIYLPMDAGKNWNGDRESAAREIIFGGSSWDKAAGLFLKDHEPVSGEEFDDLVSRLRAGGVNVTEFLEKANRLDDPNRRSFGSELFGRRRD